MRPFLRLSVSAGAVGIVLTIIACNRGDDRGADTTRPAVPGTYTAAEFQRLRWLDGRWRGRTEDDKAFFEQYRFLDDSTIAMHAFADSAFAQPNDSARITLRGGTVANRSASARWVAERLDTLGVEFAPDSGATNYFAWTKESPDSWTATLRWMDKGGKARRVAYALQRMSP